MTESKPNPLEEFRSLRDRIVEWAGWEDRDCKEPECELCQYCDGLDAAIKAWSQGLESIAQLEAENKALREDGARRSCVAISRSSITGTPPRRYYKGGDVAARLFNSMISHKNNEATAEEALLEAAGVNPEKPEAWPCTNMYFDDYDGSFEWVLKEEWRPTAEILDRWAIMGFARCWLYVERHKNEQYYSLHERKYAIDNRRNGLKDEG